MEQDKQKTRITKNEAEDRKRKVARLLCIGKKSRYEIQQWIQDEYDVGEAQAKNIMKQAEEYFTDDAFKDKLQDIQFARLEEIFVEARQTGNLKIALDAIEKINKIGSLYVEKKEVTIDGPKVIEIEF